ncbi:hypothetical protein SBRCBS47491_003154 [Sporothrix bragantina]|uniref:UBC core domain-containing protein n=1 Tax=Sporothrix bragantina TaxID=671064 RepID=A0ABP0BCS0_9PEZI
MSEASTENLLAVSIRTSDLSLSPEMLMAWDLDPDVFIVLLIRLRSCYMAYETLINAPRSSIDLSFRIGKCENYKPSVEDALSSFGSLAATAKGGKSNVTSTFTKILISTSLSRFMDDYFLTLAGYKEDYGCSWTDAVNDVINRTMTSGNKGPTQTLPNQRSSASIYKKSFPLLAMQFAMDQLKNCTEYCQACHARLAKSHRSLKPTVCSRDLCLYQHISLGMGRSVEYEILCQPNVVDLLINFCYTALRASNSNATDPIRSYPTNLPLKVPDWQNGLKGIYSNKAFDRPSFVLPTHPPGASSAPISQFVPGQWVTIYMGSLASHSNAHTLIGSNDVVLPSSRTAGPLPKTVLTDVHGGQITFRHAVISSVNHANSTVYLEHFEAGYTTAGDVSAEIFRYTKDFDDLEQRLKAAHLLLLLDTLPPVQHLKSELEKPTVNDLKSARGVSPAAAVLLGWIMATNRSCILQITEPSLMIHELLENRRMAPPNGYLQFCFLQGVPEADHEFQRQLEANTKHTNNYPTLLAWHGSSTVNWHSILRTGLDYTIMANGRAYGDGVYFSPDFNTSLGYATNLGTQWPKAVFDLRSVVSLYEVINAPHKFKSSAPHYVIDQKHWISMPGMHRQGTDEELVYKRPRGAFDRGSEVMDESDKAFLPKDTTKEAASATRLGSTAVTAIIIDLDSDEDGGGISEAKPVAVASTALHAPQGSRASSTLMKSGVTPYDPGKLDYTTLPQLPTPSWCTSQAQRALAREIDRMQKVQANTPLSELGWYIDFSRLDNMFQWIVELHSFDRTLPLAKDMMSLGVASIVCELRFGADYPMSPPLVRVIRPRFTPFLQGGGGNVTAGGAMCMELLTSTGWSPANQTDAVLLQVRLALCATDRPARLDRQHYMGEYGVGEAFAAYNRAAQTHGWAVPSDMQKRMHF